MKEMNHELALAIETVAGMKRGAEECLGDEFVNQVKLVERIKAFDDVLANLRIIAAQPTVAGNTDPRFYA